MLSISKMPTPSTCRSILLQLRRLRSSRASSSSSSEYSNWREALGLVWTQLARWALRANAAELSLLPLNCGTCLEDSTPPHAVTGLVISCAYDIFAQFKTLRGSP